ncbi:4'-phosphopantetheinyl transferase superfamily protein [Achromobacter anxifer]|uniref:4'-phosphopantetheinyl transferase superfamily protein n=1 Tax=Achromobacter anxifer TaxID=1287737 RepID=UPI0020C5B44F|nr:4'-phosphopantetheinyl transferase superfamily protein [Achromobacter anxifer]MDF8359327.1 4'-phosphopantetheinyl transferase superfamily protein [Achromobacter anxifer]
MDAAVSLPLRLTGEGAPVELWLLRLPAPRQRQRQAARDWLAAELARRDPQAGPGWTETPKGPRMPEGACWHSSFSYCGPYILCGLSRQGMPGVDLTGAQAWPGDADVAALYCGPEAAAELAASPPAARADAFARAWSALEARLKACRRGLEEYSPQRERHLSAARVTCQIRHDGLWAAAALCGGASGAGQAA